MVSSEGKWGAEKSLHIMLVCSITTLEGEENLGLKCSSFKSTVYIKGIKRRRKGDFYLLKEASGTRKKTSNGMGESP